MIAAALTNDTMILATYLVMSVAAGAAGDLIIMRLQPSLARPVTFGLFGALVPGVYYGMYFLFTALTGGVWWSWTLTLGAIVWSMLCGLALTLLAGGRQGNLTPPPSEGNAAFTTSPRSL
jgi:polyferredoxin